MIHVHIGPSPLALGLLIPCTLEAGFDVYLIGRPGDTSPRQYGRVGTGPEDPLSYWTVEAFEGPTDYADLSQAMRARIEGNEPMLLTCSLREKIALRQSLVEDILRQRPSGTETVFLPCENAPAAAYQDLRDVCALTGAVALRTVVNRMCKEEKRDSEGCRMVSAHSLGEWLIERPSVHCEVLEHLEAVKEVEVIDDFEARQARKLWMVNGAHQALALMAWEGAEDAPEVPAVRPDRAAELIPESSVDDLRMALKDLEISSRLSHIHAAMDSALQAEFPGLVGNLDYGLRHVIAYAEHPDNVTRVLEAFRRQDLTKFITTMNVRLGRPAKICFRCGYSVSAFAFVFDVFESLAMSLDSFLDVESIRANPNLISPESDRRALEAYLELLRDWMSEEEAVERLGRLTSALASHR